MSDDKQTERARQLLDSLQNCEAEFAKDNERRAALPPVEEIIQRRDYPPPPRRQPWADERAEKKAVRKILAEIQMQQHSEAVSNKQIEDVYLNMADIVGEYVQEEMAKLRSELRSMQADLVAAKRELEELKTNRASRAALKSVVPLRATSN